MKKKYKRKGPAIVPVHERVLRRTTIPKNKDECWIWNGPVNNAGYGMIKGDSGVKGDPKMMTVHRAVARFYCFPIDGIEVNHTCLTKNCVNPQHLTKGDPKQRCERIIKKHGKNFMKPKEPYKTCEHCGKTTHIVWFSRHHKDCYPGMNNIIKFKTV